MRFAYADPPYPGQAQKHYGPDAREVNHRFLVRHLCDDFDGWALSTGSTMLRQVLELCPDDVRIGAWVKPMAFFKRGVNPAYAWEPVIFRGGRKREIEEYTRRDWVSASVTFGRGVPGAKPERFCFWIFELLNVKPGDEFVDLFPGSGAVTEALDKWMRQCVLPLWKVRGGPALGVQMEAEVQAGGEK